MPTEQTDNEEENRSDKNDSQDENYDHETHHGIDYEDNNETRDNSDDDNQSETGDPGETNSENQTGHDHLTTIFLDGPALVQMIIPKKGTDFNNHADKQFVPYVLYIGDVKQCIKVKYIV